MNRPTTSAIVLACASTLVATSAPAQTSGIALLGTASIPGTALDRSGLTGAVSTFTQDRLGSFGSAIDYTGRDDLYVACDDRGPGDGASPWRSRYQTFQIRLKPDAPVPVSVELKATTLLVDESGRSLNGLATIFAGPDRRADARFDPEGIRVAPDGTLWICDEYGPWIDHFSPEGKRIGRLEIPEKFRIAVPGGTPEEELPPVNTKGRQSNRGFEGLAISPDGGKLWAILQSPLIQDGALDAANERIGVNCRILEVTIATGATRELVYPLSSDANGVNEILALSDHELLVLERDGKGGNDTFFRRLYRIDLRGASDVSGIESLPRRGMPAGVNAAAKTLFLNLLDAKFGLAGKTMPEKIEGLCLGPVLSDGRRTLIVTTDNDLKDDQESWFWVFAFDKIAS
ncbi:MAG: esterase-like activity of phytase family protein [Planctomycetota bacterium]|nr:esterase-like activity of phytase family protein [Planctomycetota bacterium]